MNAQDIDAMLTHKGQPCISITIPTAKYTRARKENPALIKKAVTKAKRLIAHTAWPKDQLRQLEHRLDSLEEKLDYMGFQEGVAIFLSSDFFKIQSLPFTVGEKVTLSGNFEIRDLIYFNQFLKPYYLLAVSKKRVRLFKGCGRDLEEVINNDFPKQYIEEYEYARPTIGSPSSSGLKAFERDKSILENTRLRDFFRQADNSLGKYLKGENCLFVAGVNEELADFDDVSRHANNVIGKIHGNFDVDAIHPLAETAWNIMRQNVKAYHKKLLTKLEEDFGKNLAIFGITSVWRAALEGKGLTLLVEKGYVATGYIHPSTPIHLYPTPPVGEYTIVRDAVEEIIKTVLEKGGGVQIVDNGELINSDHIALLLRY